MPKNSKKPAARATAKKPSAKKTVVKKAAAKTSTAKKSMAKTSMAKKTAATKKTAAKKTSVKGKAATTKKMTAKQPVTPKSAGSARTMSSRPAASAKTSAGAANKTSTKDKAGSVMRNKGAKNAARPGTQGADADKSYGSGFDKSAEQRSRSDNARNAEDMPAGGKAGENVRQGSTIEREGEATPAETNTTAGATASAKGSWYRGLETGETSRHS